MGFVGTLVGFTFKRVIPAFVLFLAIFFGWVLQAEIPYGRFFAVFIPVMKGYLPPPIFGHGKMVGTPIVPEDMRPGPRPEGELFVELPGGDKMPQNGLGMCCRPTAYDDELVERTILWYLLQGGRLIDGAHLYLNHEAIGRGIKRAMELGVPREEIFVTTKIWIDFYGYNTTKKTVPTFLDELGLDYIDLVLMHGPHFPLSGSPECKNLSRKECRQETWKALSELREEGVMRNVGVSNMAVVHLQELQELKNVAPISNNQIQWNPWAPQEWVDTVDFCHKNGISITAYNSLGGLQHSEVYKWEILNTLSTKYNRSVAQIMLRWAIQKGCIVIPGTGNPKYMKENLSIYSFEISSEDMAAIDGLRNDDVTNGMMAMTPDVYDNEVGAS